MATVREPSMADHCYAKLIEMFGESVDMELICETGQKHQWNFSQCVEALLMGSDSGGEKQSPPSTSNCYTPPTQQPSFSQRLQMGLNAPNAFADQRQSRERPDKSTHFDKLYFQIADGYKILILMRGLPGSGKSTLARKLLMKAGLDPAQHIVSADDYFVDQWGNYNYDRSKIGEAHQDCQNRAKALMIKNFAPIIVDNTNIRLWEMETFCVNAVDHGYIVHILESTSPWSKNPEECFKRNSHNVPFDTILNMRKTYERIQNGQELLDHFHLPKRIQFQLRSLPVVVKSPEIPPEPEVIKSFSPIENTEDIVVDSEEIVKPDPFANFNWSAHEREVSSFWEENILPQEREQLAGPSKKVHSIATPKPQRAPATKSEDSVTEKSLCDLMLSVLKDEDTPAVPDKPKETMESPQLMQAHRKGCRNENETFAEVRLAFPVVSIQYLWDLFEKCRGDANWMMNILLNETIDADNIPGGDENDDLQCDCDSATKSETPSNSGAEGKHAKPPQRQKKRANKVYDPEAEEMKRQIEERVCIGDEFYTENMKKVREWRNKKKTPTAAQPTEESTERSPVTAVEEDDDDDFDETEGEDVFEFCLGREFIRQLESHFNTNAEGLDFDKFRPNVFMKKALAKQIYHLWVESMMYQLEEQKLEALRDDEEIARQINDMNEMKRSTVKFSDLTQMASVMQAYCNNDWANGGLDLAVKLKRQKLYEIFPSVNRSTIDELLRQNEDNYERVVDTLNIAYEQNADERLLEHQNKLILQAKLEAERAPKQPTLVVNKPLSTCDAKRDALREFEENRNKAMHHYQFRQECYQKAKEAGQKRNSEVAYYYLQIANLHHRKVDHYNHLAANSIVNVHDLTHNNAELIDLHYLLVQEAIPCLEVFLDSHITRLRRHKLPYKQIFIITGRGLHSVAGIPTIKVNVKNYLDKRGLRCIEVNPGLLRVKIYSNSRTTEQFN